MNTDCWFYALSFLPPSERVRARLVSPTWCRMIDLIDTSQKDLQIVITPGPVTSGTGEPSTTVHSSDNSKLSIDGSSIVVPRLHYDTFCRLLARFGRNLKNFTIEAFDQWSDHHVLRMVEAAPKLISFRLMACKYFGEYQRLSESLMSNLCAFLARQVATMTTTLAFNLSPNSVGHRSPMRTPPNCRCSRWRTVTSSRDTWR